MKLFFYTFMVIICFACAGCYRTIIYSGDVGDGTSHFKKPIVVRVPTQGKKIKYLASRISQPGISPKMAGEYSQLLLKAKSEDAAHFNLIQQSFETYFKWSEVYFIPDSLYKDFLAGSKNVCLSSVGKLMENIAPPSDYLMISTPNNPDQLVLTDKETHRLPKPYPYKRNTFLPAFKKLFNKKNYLETQIKYFNEKLFLVR